MGCQKLQTNKHKVIINTEDITKTFKQIVLWGEATWWPKNCLMKFIRTENSPIQKGTLYRQKVLLPFAPAWSSLITDIVENKSITRRLLEGFLDGEETISILPYENGLNVEYRMNYEIKGYLNNILWRFGFHKLHDRNIRLILDSLKAYLEQ